MTRRLFRSRTDTILGGVAGGVAEYLDVDPSLVRIVWAILAIITGGIFVVLYVVMWIVVPQSLAAEPAEAAGSDSPAPGEGVATAPPPAPRPVVHRQRSGNGTLIFGLILIGVGAWFLVRQYVDINIDRLWPIGLVLLGVLLLLVSLRRSPEH